MELLSGKNGGNTTPITPIDWHYGWVRNHQLFLYKNRLDPNLLKSKLLLIIQDVPEIAGRWCKAANGDQSISLNGEGVAFDTENLAETMPAYGVNLDVELHADRYLINSLSDPIEGGPLFSVKITHFLCGGTIVGITWPHFLCDGTGYAGLIARWARLCRGLPQYPPLSLDRSRIMDAALDEQESVLQSNLIELGEAAFSQYMRQAEALEAGTKKTVLRISAGTVDKIKLGIKSKVYPNNQWISTQDVLVAKLWKKILACQHDSESFSLGFVNNFRKAYGLPENYFGNALITGILRCDAEQLKKNSVEEIAASFRAASIENVSKCRIEPTIAHLRKAQHSANRRYLFPPSFIEAHREGTIANNVGYFPISDFNFGCGLPFWIAPLNDGGQRQFLLYPALDQQDKGLYVYLNLPEEEMALFEQFIDGDFLSLVTDESLRRSGS